MRSVDSLRAAIPTPTAHRFQPFTWQGHRAIAPNLYDFRARIWSADLGAFLQPDEYVFLSHGGTLWSWPGQNPMRWRDPSGRLGMDGASTDRAIGSEQDWGDPNFRRGMNAGALGAAFAAVAVFGAGIEGGVTSIIAALTRSSSAVVRAAGGLASAATGAVKACSSDGTSVGSSTQSPTATAAAARGASTVLGRTSAQLASKFKHAKDFGVVGNYNKANAAEFSRAIHQHVNSPGVRAIQGTYHKAPVTHYLDPSSGLNVIADPAGNFVSGWRLGAEQLKNVLAHGGL